MNESWLKEPTPHDYALVYPLIRVLLKMVREERLWREKDEVSAFPASPSLNDDVFEHSTS